MNGLSLDSGLAAPQMRQPHTPPPKRDLHVEDVSVCFGNGGLKPSPGKRRKLVEKQDSLGTMLRRGIVEHQLGLSVNLMLLIGLSYVLFPALRDRMSAFFWLSYRSSRKAGLYDVGERDVYLVGSFIVFFTALRAFSLDYVLMPVAGWAGIDKKKVRSRFAEQSYMMTYYIIYWTWGLLLFIHETPSGVHDVRSLLVSLWSGWPYLDLSASMKVYYISQLAFWIQQIVVIHIEERRKDHMQMFTHHIITVMLLAGSYPGRHTRVGNAVLVCMDVVDFIFPLAKILRYLSMQTACDAAFAAFVVFWLASRHVAYNAILWSLYALTPNVTLHYGRYSTKDSAMLSDDAGTNMIDNLFQPILHPDAQYVSWNPPVRWMFISLLLALQCITIGWFIMICRVVMRVLRGEGADDTRSDGEDEAEDEEVDVVPAQASEPLRAMPEPEKSLPRFIEVEATGEDFTHYPKRKGSGSKRKSKGKGMSSGLNLGEHKDFLNRIGCLSDEQLAREREKRGDSMSPRPGSATDKK
ncbi:hypothetical protein LTR36_006717 [Oleoguttula mirabilis]|uniref:TLC domain-containing protein n=1 Tax=Oleoguttula mirabilis TaxID=1507867 RepID=A0AAV9JCE9_9PEZI|nr:hypothetical protein LTR36_006717 [Oleoguttula mirabilis]